MGPGRKNRPCWPHFRLGLLAGSPSRKPNRTARKAIKDEHKKEQPVCPRCVQAMARDVCSICTNAKLTYAREWQEAPTPHSPVYPRSALNDVLFKSEPLQAKYITNRRLPPPRLASPREFRKKSLSRAPPPSPPEDANCVHIKLTVSKRRKGNAVLFPARGLLG